MFEKMGVLGHLVRLLSAMFLGLIVPYALYRALSPLDALLASLLTLGLMVSLPLVLMLVFYGRLQSAKYLFIFIWLVYAAGMWIYLLTSISAAFQGCFWVPALAVLAGGAFLLFVFLRKRGVDFSQLLHRGGEGLEEEFEGKTGEVEELGVEKRAPVEEDKVLPVLIGSLNDVQCRILMTLIESRRQYSKKELHRLVKATYPRTLRSVEELRELGLVEVIELPRRAKGAPVLHAVRASRSLM